MGYTPPPKVVVKVEYGDTVYTIKETAELHRTHASNVADDVAGLIMHLQQKSNVSRKWDQATE